MKRNERFQMQERIIALARIKSTGSLPDLAINLGLSMRTTKRLIKELRDQGIPIQFDRIRVSYTI